MCIIWEKKKTNQHHTEEMQLLEDETCCRMESDMPFGSWGDAKDIVGYEDDKIHIRMPLWMPKHVQEGSKRAKTHA